MLVGRAHAGRRLAGILGLGTALALAATTSASATISSIASDWCLSCLPGAVHRIVAGKPTSMVVRGQFVDLATRAEISGTGVSVSLGNRAGGSDSSVVVNFTFHGKAPLGERTVKLRYAIETSGPDTFKVKVVPGGRVDRIELRVPGTGGGGAAPRLIPPNTVPIDQPVTLVFTGSGLGHAVVAPSANIRNARTLAGATDTRLEVALEFTRNGAVHVNLVDGDVGPQPGNLLYKFFYAGAQVVTVTGAGSSTPAPVPRIPSGGTATPTPFVDVAPRANMLNVFRRTGSPVTVGGASFLPVEDRWCADNQVATPTAASVAKLITVPDIVWGVSNVGTAEINIGFTAQLGSGDQVLQVGTVAGGTLHPGGTRDFSFRRTRSQIRVIRFAIPNPAGCFVNPRDPDFFEDPPFTVTVDVQNAVPEAAGARANNRRSF